MLRRPLRLPDARLDDYDAVYLPGGHGPMEDLWQDADSRAAADGGAGLWQAAGHRLPRPGRDAGHPIHGRSPFAGRQVTGFTNEEENAVGLAPKARWLLEDELVALGVDFAKGEMWQPYTVVDGNLFTGQNPASAAELAGRLLKVL